MNRILCSTGAILGKANDNDYTLLPDFSGQLRCDGFELMISSTWYTDIDNIMKEIKSYGLTIPVLHGQKSLGESLCGMTTTYSDGRFTDYVMTAEEDKEAFEEGTARFLLNLKAARIVGASKMVLHLWNGSVSDKNIKENIKKFEIWRYAAKRAGIELLAENVICNTNDPLCNIDMVAKEYPDADFTYDTKMAEFHGQTMDIFDDRYNYLVREGRIKHLHVNDYGGGVMDWSDMRVLPVGKGHVDFEGFFSKLSSYGYKGDFTVEATAVDKDGNVDFDMLNDSFLRLQELKKRFFAC